MTTTTSICRTKTLHLLLYITLVSIGSGYTALNVRARFLRRPSTFAQRPHQRQGIYEQITGKRGQGI